MGQQEWDDLGRRIQDIIDQAVKAQDYQKLSQNINQTVNRAIDTGGEVLKSALNSAFNGANPEHNARAYETHRNHGYQQPPFGRQQRIVPEKKKETALNLYGRTTGERAAGMVMTIVGGITTAGLGLGCMITAIVGAAMGEGVTLIVSAGLAVGTALAGVILGKGCRLLGKLSRFQKYVRTLGEHTYCNFERLSRTVGKPVKFVKKDIKTMISKGWFLEGHVDKQETCLITSNETYRQYVETQRQLELKEQAKDPRVEADERVSKEVQEVLDKGNEYLVKIRRSNDAIPGEEISEKISHMELIVQRIFERAKDHPEIIPDLKRLMDYYLPMTVKLLDAYEDMDRQPIQGENIRSSKREIEETIDTLNGAFEKILDSVFKDTAWDVSSDISVLHTVLAQEGLTEDDFTKMKREAAQKEAL